MGAPRRLVVRDLTLGILGIALFGFLLPTAWNPGQVIIAAASTVAFGSFQYLSERRAFPSRYYELRAYLRNHTLQHAVLVALQTTVAVVPLLVVELSVAHLYVGGFFGVYVGLAGYRVLYGVVRPVPRARLDRA